MSVNSNLTGLNITTVYDGMVLIQEQIVGSDTASVTFSNIPQTGFSHLRLIGMGRVTEVSTDGYLAVQFNGDSGSNYDGQQHRSIAAAPASANVFGATSGRVSDITGASAGAAAQIGSFDAVIPFYTGTTFEKTLNSVGGAKYGTSGSNTNQWQSSVWWRSSAAITSITLISQSGANIKAGSSFGLYGISNTVGATVATGDTNMNVYGRLTTESGVPTSSSDRTSQGTLYFTPYNGSSIPLFNGTRWSRQSFNEISLALTLTSGKNYDVFVYNSAGTPTLELSAAWSSDTARTDAIALQNGVYVKSGTPTRLWLGTIRASGANVTEDSLAKRFVWNRYNQTPRQMKNATETADSWNYTTATYRQANANAANQLDYVVGDAAAYMQVRCCAMVSNTSGGIGVSTGIGVDSTSTNSATIMGTTGGAASTGLQALSLYDGAPGLGRHTIVWLEISTASGTTTWNGDNGLPTRFQSGIQGTIWN